MSTISKTGVLVFPRAKPIGVNSSSSREAIREDAAFPTEVIDYIKFDIFDHRNNTLEDTIYLYLPKQLEEKYNMAWGEVKLGAGGDALKSAAMKAMAAKDDISQADFSSEISQFASSGVNQLGFKAASTAISGALGVIGQDAGDLNRDTLASLTMGKIFNPYAESVFKGQQNFRKHKFTWTLIPKSSSDVSEIYQIIRKLRKATLPSKDGNNWLNIPEYFRAQIVRYVDSGGGNDRIEDPGTGGQAGVLNSIIQFPTKLVCEDMTVSMPDYRSVRSTMEGSREADFGALQYNLTLTFQETEYLTKETFEPPGMDSNVQLGEAWTEDQLASWAGTNSGLW